MNVQELSSISGPVYAPTRSSELREQAREWGQTRRWQLGWKRVLDVTCSLAGLMVLSPFLLVLAVLVRRKLGSPVLFAQRRPGRFEEPFTMCKFRTMTDERGPDGVLLHDRLRLTPFGAFLRRTSLDELPELFNVLRGDMSLVGPRPLLEQYLPWYRPAERVRHWMRPGITGLAQVSGRNLVPWDQRLGLDVRYVTEWSLWLDIQVLVSTVMPVLRRGGVVVIPDQSMRDLDEERRAGMPRSGNHASPIEK